MGDFEYLFQIGNALLWLYGIVSLFVFFYGIYSLISNSSLDFSTKRSGSRLPIDFGKPPINIGLWGPPLNFEDVSYKTGSAANFQGWIYILVGIFMLASFIYIKFFIH